MDNQTSEAVQLTLADLGALKQLVELASRRGAFHAGEMTGVGTVFDKLAAFLLHVEQEQAKAAANQPVVASTGETK